MGPIVLQGILPNCVAAAESFPAGHGLAAGLLGGGGARWYAFRMGAREGDVAGADQSGAGGGGRRRAQMGALAVSCIRGGGAGISAEEWRSAAASCAVGSAPIAVAALSTVVAALVAAAMAAIGVRAKRALGTLSQPVAPTLTKPRVPARSLPRATTVRAPFRLPSADCRIRSARGARCVVARSADARPQDARRLPSTIRSPPPPSTPSLMRHRHP